jgi:hypothetical protein
MHRIITLMAFLAIMVVPSTAFAAPDKADCGKKLERSYSKLYKKVAKRHGTRAPGRNIRAYGVVRRNQTVRLARCGELRRSRKQLKKLLVVPKPYTNVSTAIVDSGAPAQMPSGVETSYAASNGGSSNAYVDPNCESGGNSQVYDPSGTYWGKYQFDRQTWEAHGGSSSSYGNASEIEQDRVAANVQYDAWPNC